MERKTTDHIAKPYLMNGKDTSSYPFPEVNELDINLSQLAKNLNIIRGLIGPGRKLLIVLKGDAYGHGMLPIAYELERFNCDAFGVVRLCEAMALREAGIRTPIHLLAPVSPSQAPWIIKHDITAMVDYEDIVRELYEECVKYNKSAKVHIKVNTGLNRYGIEPAAAVDFFRVIQEKYPRIEVEGVYTHFQNPDYNRDVTMKQLERFDAVIRQLEQNNLKPSLVHAAGSAGIINYPKAYYNMVRCGVLLFGLEHTEGEKSFPEGIKPLMTLKGRIIKIRVIKASEYAGYGNAYIADKDTTIAVIGLGYADGISRGWKEVLIKGRRVPVINYFMDGVMVNLSDLKETVHEFDEAVFIGAQGDESIGWGEVCRWFGTYEDEQTHYIAQRVPKHYFYE